MYVVRSDYFEDYLYDSAGRHQITESGVSETLEVALPLEYVAENEGLRDETSATT